MMIVTALYKDGDDDDDPIAYTDDVDDDCLPSDNIRLSNNIG